MPNWCFSKYYIRSCDDSAEQLYNRMKRLQEMKEPLKPNGFGTTWLGNLVEDLGVDFNKVQCRGSWDELTFDNGILGFTTETAWYRCTEVEDLISERYPNIEIAFLCEEPGMCIYEKKTVTNSSRKTISSKPMTEIRNTVPRRKRLNSYPIISV